MIENHINDNNSSDPKPEDTQPHQQVSEINAPLDETMATVTGGADSSPETTPIAQTQINRVATSTVDRGVQKAAQKKRRSGWLVAVLGLLAMVLIAGLSGLGGYLSGIEMRLDAEGTQVAQVAQEQYELAMKDIETGAYSFARQRLEYVLRIAPSYPGAVDKLADVLLELNTTATPTLVPTQSPTSTPDLRGVQELFTQAQQAVLNGDWKAAIDALNSLRGTDPEFNPVEVDGLYFISFRNLGSDKILKEANLEEGIYHFSLAERFGLLDAEANALANWSSLYIKGASFWELDWGQATFYFSQVAPYAPNLRDGSGLTAMQRYQTAIVKYIQKLFEEKNWCEAKAQIEIALTMMQTAELQEAYVTASDRCAAEKK